MTKLSETAHRVTANLMVMRPTTLSIDLLEKRQPDTASGKMRIAHVIGSIESQSGPSYSVPRLCTALSNRGHDVTLNSLSGQPSETLNGYRDRRFEWDLIQAPILGRLRRSRTLRQALMNAVDETDLFHGHGLWRLPNIYPADAARRQGKPLVISPRGMLAASALEFSAASKRVFWALSQGRAARSASALHATSEQEYRDIRAYGLRQPVAIIPNGIDLPELSPTDGAVAPRVLFLGRLHPVKALDRLVLAWRELQAHFPEWRLSIVGPSEIGYDEILRGLIRDNGLRSVELGGAVSGAEKQKLLQGADIFVLPSLSENFAISVAESLAAGTPVIASRGTPWQGLETNGCGWWIDHGVAPLAATLRQAMSLSRHERHAMGERGRQWMAREFSWEPIASEMASLYAWLLGGGKTPDCVRMD